MKYSGKMIGLILVLAALVFSGCSNAPSDEEAAMEVVRAFKQAQYDVQAAEAEKDLLDYSMQQVEKTQPYFAEKAYDAYMRNRGLLHEKYALENGVNIKLKSIEMENMKQDNMEPDTLSFSYSMEVEFTPAKSESDEEPIVITRKAHMALMKTDGAWKIIGDKDRPFNPNHTVQELESDQ